MKCESFDHDYKLLIDPDYKLLVDDFDYKLPKFSIIEKGTKFYRRQKENNFESINQEIWLDYTGTMSECKISFLKDTSDEYTEEYLNRTKLYFGEHLMQFQVNKDLLIFHFPEYAYAYSEYWVKYMCVTTTRSFCVDGYTLDFLTYNPNEIYKDLPSIPGFRELCILNAENISLV